MKVTLVLSLVLLACFIGCSLQRSSENGESGSEEMASMGRGPHAGSKARQQKFRIRLLNRLLGKIAWKAQRGLGVNGTRLAQTLREALNNEVNPPTPATQAPNTTAEASTATTQAPNTTAEASTATTQAPNTTAEASTATTQAPITTAEASTATTQAPIMTAEASTATPQAPTTTAEATPTTT
ncbi:hypothetical protein ACOMHN_045660 [Nucella lapillus]